MARYCAKLNDFYPSDPFEALVVDEALDTMSEILAKVPTAKNETETKMQREEFQAGFLTAAAKLLEARIQKYGDGKGFASSSSVADLFLLGVVQIFAMEFFDNFNPKFFDAYPGITYVSTIASRGCCSKFGVCLTIRHCSTTEKGQPSNKFPKMRKLLLTILPLASIFECDIRKKTPVWFYIHMENMIL